MHGDHGDRPGALPLHAARRRHLHRDRSAPPTPPAGRSSTSFYRWATGKDWVPWNDESQFKMDVIPDRTRYAVGDTATVLFASPFTDAEAWITVEREGLHRAAPAADPERHDHAQAPDHRGVRAQRVRLDHRRSRAQRAARARSTIPGRPTIRVGYAELRVTPERKRLTVEVAPLAPEYRPGDTARVSLAGARCGRTGSAERGDALGGGRGRARAHRIPDARPDRPALPAARPRNAARQHAHDRGAAGGRR